MGPPQWEAKGKFPPSYVPTCSSANVQDSGADDNLDMTMIAERQSDSAKSGEPEDSQRGLTASQGGSLCKDGPQPPKADLRLVRGGQIATLTLVLSLRW